MGVEPRLLFLLGVEGECAGRGNESKGGRVEGIFTATGNCPRGFWKRILFGFHPPLSPRLSVILIGQIKSPKLEYLNVVPYSVVIRWVIRA